MVLSGGVNYNDSMDCFSYLSASVESDTSLLLWISPTAVYTRKVEMVSDSMANRSNVNVR